jgi:hypothetical protein
MSYITICRDRGTHEKPRIESVKRESKGFEGVRVEPCDECRKWCETDLWLEIQNHEREGRDEWCREGGQQP